MRRLARIALGVYLIGVFVVYCRLSEPAEPRP